MQLAAFSCLHSKRQPFHAVSLPGEHCCSHRRILRIFWKGLSIFSARRRRFFSRVLLAQINRYRKASQHRSKQCSSHVAGGPLSTMCPYMRLRASVCLRIWRWNFVRELFTHAVQYSSLFFITREKKSREMNSLHLAAPYKIENREVKPSEVKWSETKSRQVKIFRRVPVKWN